MSKPEIELADVIRRYGSAYMEQYGAFIMPSQRRAMQDIEECMTEKRGGGRYHCNDCNETFWCYHGCGNRSCPKCHGRQTAEWLKSREAEMLPCAYFHAVATVPGEMRTLFLRHQKALYGLLMRISAQSVRDLAAKDKYVGADVGILAVLHTWTSQLHHHPHVHMLVTGGGLSADKRDWREARNDFLVPVKMLSSMIKGRFAEALRNDHPEIYREVPVKVWQKEWCSFCKPFGEGRDAVLRYLSRYVFRIAITNSRILAMDESHITYRYKDNSTGRMKVEKILGVEFLRRYMMHVLPKGLHKVRYYGLWHSSRKADQLRLRTLLQLVNPPCNGPQAEQSLLASLAEEALEKSECEAHTYTIKCPKCGCTNVELKETKRRRFRPMT